MQTQLLKRTQRTQAYAINTAYACMSPSQSVRSVRAPFRARTRAYAGHVDAGKGKR